MPTDCYANPNPIFRPAMRVIEAITNSNPAQVTTTVNHLYINGLIVRLIIPNGVGMNQANGQSGIITITGPTTFLIDIDTTLYDPFVLPLTPPESYTCAQVIPFAEENSILTGAVQNVLPFN